MLQCEFSPVTLASSHSLKKQQKKGLTDIDCKTESECSWLFVLFASVWDHDGELTCPRCILPVPLVTLCRISADTKRKSFIKRLEIVYRKIADMFTSYCISSERLCEFIWMDVTVEKESIFNLLKNGT